MGYSPWGQKESGATDRLTAAPPVSSQGTVDWLCLYSTQLHFRALGKRVVSL